MTHQKGIHVPFGQIQPLSFNRLIQHYLVPAAWGSRQSSLPHTCLSKQMWPFLHAANYSRRCSQEPCFYAVVVNIAGAEESWADRLQLLLSISVRPNANGHPTVCSARKLFFIDRTSEAFYTNYLTRLTSTLERNWAAREKGQNALMLNFISKGHVQLFSSHIQNHINLPKVAFK